MTTKNKLAEFARNQIYSTPHRLSCAIFLAVHSSLTTSRALIGNNYLESRANQFAEHPVATTFEVMVPYLVTYLSNSIGRKLR